MEVQATSGTGDREQTGTQTITVTVMNADEGQTGTVSIDDTAPMVDDALTASTADVADPDGLPDPFAPTWQWYSTPAGGAETVISGATSATYTVVAADLGAALTAKASWTDVGGFANRLASAPTNAVTATDSGTLPELRVADASATEGEDVTFTVTLSAASTQAVTATWTASIGSGDTAVEADLGSPPTGTVSIAAGQTTATFTVPAAEDTADEEDETFTVTLSGVSTNAQLASDPTATGTIIDDDAPPPVTPTPGICDRTQQVRDAIVGLIPSVSNCADVTDTHLAGIDTFSPLSLNYAGLTALKAGDFDGLTALTVLWLPSNGLTELPA